MMATVPHVTSGLGLKKFQADGFLLIRVYTLLITINFTSIAVSYFCKFINTMQFHNDLTDIFDKIKLPAYSLCNNDVIQTVSNCKTISEI